jgi:small subunit ribosomal protein S11
MGKKRVADKEGKIIDSGVKARVLAREPDRTVTRGKLHVQATFNNTMLTLTDTDGDVLFSSSSGTLGFNGAKKGTPFAAGKVGELVGAKARQYDMEAAEVIVKGIGAGREQAIRSFAAEGITLSSISDETPVPHNGPRSPKPRRV